MIDGTFRRAEDDWRFYVFPMKNYPDQSKPGITEDLEDRKKQSWNEYGDFYNWLELPRLDAWLVEQALLQATQRCWLPPTELEQKKWPGYQELRVMSCEETWNQSHHFLSILEDLGRETFAATYLPCNPDEKEKLLQIAASN